MSDPLHPNPLNDGERLRSLEDERLAQGRPGPGDNLDGLREISQAWSENRSTAYLLRKSWSDPVSRLMFWLGMSIIVSGWIYLWAQ